MNIQMILDYLTELNANNNREWYHAHKAEYQAVNGQFEELIQALILRIGAFDGGVLGHAPKELTFKLVRDTRFSPAITRRFGRISRPWESCPSRLATI